MRLFAKLFVVALILVAPACSSSGGDGGGPTNPGGGPVDISGNWDFQFQVTAIRLDFRHDHFDILL